MLTEAQCMERYGVPRLPSDPTERIRIIQPWKKSTGPRTVAGKLMSSRNRLKHGLCCKSILISFVARVRLEELFLEDFKVEVAPLLKELDQRVPGLKEEIEQLMKILEPEETKDELQT